jgi:hypothetical protein
MSPDDFQQAWQATSSQSRVTIDADLLVKEVRRNQQQFACTILARDIREIGVALILLPVWVYLGARFSLPWTWYLTIPGLIWIAAFMVIDRRRHKQRPPAPDEPLRQHIQYSLAQVEHQIWLLSNILWWYILPVAIPCLAFFAQNAWEGYVRGRAFGDFVPPFLSSVAFAGGVMGFVYWLNQYAVRSGLEPRRQELAALLSSLGEEGDA